MRNQRKSVNDINTINSPRVGRRRKQTYLQLHTLANRRDRLRNEMERLDARREKVEKNLKEVNKHIQIVLSKSEDVNPDDLNSANGNIPGRNRNNLTY